tara:strand:- start:179 stop:406 length:228 start_codon:yes stop_codon:yes gene_type:complete
MWAKNHQHLLFSNPGSQPLPNHNSRFLIDLFGIDFRELIENGASAGTRTRVQALATPGDNHYTTLAVVVPPAGSI